MQAYRILVVDDNSSNVKLVSAVLTARGCKVDTSPDAEVAQAMLAACSYDLILVDIELPGMDGLTLTRGLKAEEKTRHIPIVALTAFAMKGDDQRAFEAGCVGYITKPIDVRTLYDDLRKHLND